MLLVLLLVDLIIVPGIICRKLALFGEGILVGGSSLSLSKIVLFVTVK
jgi:hypothetical protein